MNQLIDRHVCFQLTQAFNVAIHVSQLQRPVEVEAVLRHYAEDMSPSVIKTVRKYNTRACD